jgi:hypothetical protein
MNCGRDPIESLLSGKVRAYFLPGHRLVQRHGLVNGAPTPYDSGNHGVS